MSRACSAPYASLMNAKRISKKKPRKTKLSKGGSQVRPVDVHDEAERAVAEAAVRALREGRVAMKAAHDPKTYMAAYAKVYAGADRVTQVAIEALEADEEEEPDVVVVGGVMWRAVVSCEATYRCLRGPLRCSRKLYRSKRNGPTRSFFEERRGVMDGSFFPALGRVVVETVAEIPAERAHAILERATGQSLSTATMKRTTVSVGNALRDEEAKFFTARIQRRAVPKEARAVVISVDALSFNLRGEGYKQATAATISLLDARGDRIETIKLGEMPEEGKATIMDRVEREVRAILKKRPSLKTEVVIDGAPDLRAHLLARFPDALHITDFFHVVEHIADGLRTIFPHDELLRDSMRAHLCHVLKHEKGGARWVMNWLRDPFRVLGARMSSARQKLVDKHANYIRGQLPYLNYPKAANDNLDLGSGAVEASCKTLVTQRLKISGAKWSREGARAILYVRSLAQSGRFDDAIGFHHARRLKHAA